MQIIFTAFLHAIKFPKRQQSGFTKAGFTGLWLRWLVCLSLSPHFLALGRPRPSGQDAAGREISAAATFAALLFRSLPREEVTVCKHNTVFHSYLGALGLIPPPQWRPHY